MADHSTLIKIWRTLNSGKNVLVFVDSDDYYNRVDAIAKWFQSITSVKISTEEMKMLNDSYLIFRKLHWGVNEATRGDYEIIFIDDKTSQEIVRSIA